MFDAFIPDGPLHADLAIAGLAFGVFVAVFAARRPRAWIALILAVFVVAIEVRLDGGIADGWILDVFRDRDNTWLAVAALVGVPLLAAQRPVGSTTAAFAALGATAGVWAVVPDTETALLAGMLLLGAVAGSPRDEQSRWYALLAVLPVVAAIAGSVGRPERLNAGIGVGFLGAALALSVLVFSRGFWRAQRAGTPTTVDRGSTSSMTTAPAPTTAS